MKCHRGFLPRCFTEGRFDDQDPPIRIRPILFDDVRTGTRSTFNGRCSCMIWAMEEAGLVKRRFETIRDDLPGVLGS